MHTISIANSSYQFHDEIRGSALTTVKSLYYIHLSKRACVAVVIETYILDHKKSSTLYSVLFIANDILRESHLNLDKYTYWQQNKGLTARATFFPQ